MKKIFLIAGVMILTAPVLLAETMDLEQLLTQAENNNPNVQQIKQQIDSLKTQADALYGIYDHRLNLTAGLNALKNQPTSAFDSTDHGFGLSGKLGWSKKLESGMELGLSGEMNYQNTSYAGLPPGLTFPSELSTSKIGANLSMPFAQNSGGILDRLLIESTLNQLNQQKIVLQQKLRDERFNVYFTYLQTQVSLRLIKLRKETLDRNKEYEVIAKRKRQTGYIQDPEFVQAQLAVISAEKDYLEIKEQYRNALLEVKRVCSLDPEFNLEMTEGSVDLLPTPAGYENLQQKLLTSDLMQQSLSLNILVSMQKMQAAENALQAQWNLQSSLTLTGKKADLIGSVGEITGFYPTLFVGIQSDLIGATTKEKSDAELADLNKKIAENNLLNYQTQLKHRFKKAYDQYQFNLEMEKTNEKLLAKYREYLKELKIEYAQGKVDRFQITQAENSYVLAELGSIQNLSSKVMNLLNLQYLLGEI